MPQARRAIADIAWQERAAVGVRAPAPRSRPSRRSRRARRASRDLVVSLKAEKAASVTAIIITAAAIFSHMQAGLAQQHHFPRDMRHFRSFVIGDVIRDFFRLMTAGFFAPFLHL